MRTMRQRRKYTKEFKDNAVSLVLSGRAAIEVAHDLGIDISTLNRWKKLYLDEQDNKYDGLGESPSALAAENKRLRKELAEQKEIVMILKKTVKYIS